MFQYLQERKIWHTLENELNSEILNLQSKIGKLPKRSKKTVVVSAYALVGHINAVATEGSQLIPI